MTDQHPLTEGLCCQLWQDNKDNWLKLQEPCPATRRVMRAAADWQLEQVIEWIRENLWIEENDLPRYLNNTTPEEGAVIDEWKIIFNLKEAMRPQEDN